MQILENIDQAFDSTEYGKVYKAVISNTEKMLIEKALEKTSGNQILAARFLGLNRNTLHSKVKKLNINLEKFKS